MVFIMKFLKCSQIIYYFNRTFSQHMLDFHNFCSLRSNLFLLFLPIVELCIASREWMDHTMY